MDIVIGIPLMFLFYIFGGWGLVFLAGFPMIYIVSKIVQLVDYVALTPKECKVIKTATRKKTPVLAIGDDTSVCELTRAKEVGDEGFVKTMTEWIGFLPRPKYQKFRQPNVAEGRFKGPDATGTELEAEQRFLTEEFEKQRSLQEKLRSLTTRVYTLKHARIPILFGYSAKAIVTNLEALANLEYAHPVDAETEVTIGGKIKKVVNVLFPVDFSTLKAHFKGGWNEEQIDARIKRQDIIGLLKGKKYFGMEAMKTVAILAILIIGIIVTYGLTMYFLK